MSLPSLNQVHFYLWQITLLDDLLPISVFFFIAYNHLKVYRLLQLRHSAQILENKNFVGVNFHEISQSGSIILFSHSMCYLLP